MLKSIYFKGICIAALLITLLFACTLVNGDGKQGICTLSDSVKTCIVSDDSVLAIYYWDTEEGGTAPVIDTTCFYRTECGKVKEESRPLLSLAYPEYDCFHHEVRNIMTIHTTYEERIYLLYIWSRIGTNEFTHDLIALKVEGEKLKTVGIFPDNKAGISMDIDQMWHMLIPINILILKSYILFCNMPFKNTTHFMCNFTSYEKWVSLLTHN